MNDKLREILGILSGYKQKFDKAQVELKETKSVIAEGERITDVILAVLKSWNEPH